MKLDLRTLLLFLLSLFVAGCSSRRIKLEYPSAWSTDDPALSPRWVVAYPEQLAGALPPLEAARQKQGFEVVRIPDASSEAVSDHVREIRLGSRHLDCLVLIGNTSLRTSPDGQFHRMNGKSSDSRYAMMGTNSTPLFPVGRLPVSTVEEANQLIAKILAFERSRDDATNNKAGVLLVGNPTGGSKRVKAADMMISSLSRSLLRKAHSSWALTGAADVPGHRFASTSEELPQEFRRQLNLPYHVGAYFGHSSAHTLCRMDGGKAGLAGVIANSFTTKSWQKLTPSDRRGLFVSCGCYCLKSDGAVGYQSVLASGGPVAFIGATGASHAAIGYLAAKGTVGMMNEIPPPTAGEWFLGIQRAIATETMSRPLFYLFDKFDGSDGEHTLLEQRREHLEMWMLVGDPATRIY